MRALSLVSAILILPCVSFAQGWIEYVDRSQFFSVNFPGEPEVEEIAYLSEYGGTFPAHVYTVRTNGRLYSATVVDFAEAERIYEELPDKTDEANIPALWLYDQRASVAYAARNLRLRGGEVTYDAWHHINLVEGHQLQITNTDQSRTYAGIYLHNSRLYILEATVPPGSPPQGHFQQSLSFLDEEGKSIRYELRPDGSRTRIR